MDMSGLIKNGNQYCSNCGFILPVSVAEKEKLERELERLREALNQILDKVPVKHTAETDDDKVSRAVAMLESVNTLVESGYMQEVDK